MEEELNFKNATMYIDGKPIGNATDISAMVLKQNNKSISNFANKIVHTSLKMKPSNKLISQLFKVTRKGQEADRLTNIMRYTRKLRVKKKLYNRIVKLWR